MQVIVVDDDPVCRTLLKSLLTQWRFDVYLAHDGKEAWDVLSLPNPPPIAIVDWMMPRMDGFELCQLVRSRCTEQEIYILLMTGSRKKEDVMKVLVAGADDYLIKPFDPTDLKIHLRTAMRILSLQGELREYREHVVTK